MILSSLLDTDLYKFTMMQVVLHQFPGAQVEYRFKCRNSVPLAPYVNEIREEIRHLCTLRFQDAELAYLRTLRFIKSDFVDFLGLFKLNEKYIEVKALPSGDIDISICGPWLHTILFEIPVLAIVNEVYFRNTATAARHAQGRERLDRKIAQLQGEGLSELKIADYGTRRRFSKSWHEEVLRRLADRLGAGPAGQLAGTSNVLYAMKLGMTPLGTVAHEYLQACQALGPRLRDSQVFAFESWAKEYRGDLGIALSDVYGMSAFLRDFDMYFCKLFDTRELVSWTSNRELEKPWTWTSGVNCLPGAKGIFSNGEEGGPWGGQLAELSTPSRRGGRLSPPRRLVKQPRCSRASRPGRVSHRGGAITLGCAVVAVRQIASLV